MTVPFVFPQNMIELDIWKDLTKSSPNYESATIIQYMTVRDFNDWLTDIQTDCKFNKRDNLRKRESQAKLYKRNDFLSAGSDTFTCQSTGTPIIKLGINGVPFVKRAKKTLKCNCKSRITALYASGYEHFAGKEINVFEHGDKMVKVTYNWKHEHPVAKLDYFYMSTLSKRMRSALRIVVARGVTYSEIDQARSQYLESRKGNLTLPELLKIKPHHVRYERRLILESFALKSKSLESSLRIWGDEVISQGGSASFSDTFPDFSGKPSLICLETSKKKKVWSFFFMTKWQRKVLSDNGTVFHLDATHRTCPGFGKRDDIFLFTIVVKNHTTGKGAPVAFYISNSQSSIVVADFLGKVKDFCHFQPTQAVIDCDAAETKALRHIWGQGLLIVYCRFHILRAFETKLVQKFKPGSDATEMTNQMKDDFTKVIDSRSLAEADERIGYFIERYSSHSQFVNYVKKQWFSKIELIVGGLSAQFDSTSGTNNLAESYHSRLKNDFLTSTNQRPDVLVYTLLQKVLLSYRGYESRVILDANLSIDYKGEKDAQASARMIQIDDYEEIITHLGAKTLQVKSFTGRPVEYMVTVHDLHPSCTCPAFLNSGESWCKHIFLGEFFLFSRRSKPFEDFVSTGGNVQEAMDSLAALDDLEGEMMSIVGEDAIDPELREEESFYETSTSEANLYSAEDGSSNTATVSSGEESDLGANLDRNVIESVSQMNEIDRLQKTPSSDKWKVGTVYMHGDIVVPQTRDIAQKNREDAAKAAEGKRNSKQHLIRRLLRIFKDFVTDFLKDNSVERQSRTIDQVEAFLKGNYGTSEAFSGKQS